MQGANSGALGSVFVAALRHFLRRKCAFGSQNDAQKWSRIHTFSGESVPSGETPRLHGDIPVSPDTHFLRRKCAFGRQNDAHICPYLQPGTKNAQNELPEAIFAHICSQAPQMLKIRPLRPYLPTSVASPPKCSK